MGDSRQGLALLWAMGIIFTIAFVIVVYAEMQSNPQLMLSGINSNINLEGKENRFGILNSALYAVITTATSCGAVNAMHDSFTALGEIILMWLIQLSEVVFGGVGSGLFGMLLFVMLVVFLTGLMIGRAPEYFGKKIEIQEMKLTTITILITPCLTLLATALALFAEAGRSAILNPGTHAFSEVLYAFSSAANNNGSAFAGLNRNNLFYNITLSIVMFLGRFGLIKAVIATAGIMVRKKHQPENFATLPTHGPLFIGLLILTVFIIGALTFVPALALGPIAEHLQIWHTS